MKLKDKVGIKFIKASLPYISFTNLYGILNLTEKEPDSEEKTKIIEMVNKEIEMRMANRKYKTFTEALQDKRDKLG